MSDAENFQITDDMDDFDTGITLSFPSSRSKALDMCVNSFLENNEIDAYSDPDEIVEQLMAFVQNEFRRHNEAAPKGTKMPVPSDLTPAMIAKIMLKMYCIKNINCAGIESDEKYDLLGIYQEDGPDKGIYISREKEIQKIICRFNPELNSSQIKLTVSLLQINAERVERCSDPNLIAVNNGIFNYKTKILEPFDCEKVFTAKCCVDYNPAAANVTITNKKDNTTWNVEDWIKEMFDDPDIPETIWQILGAVIRPNVRWGKSAWFVSAKGCNGKGSLCTLARNLAGSRSCASIQLSDFSREFMLEPLIGATAIITDENDVGDYIERSANFKAVVTNDVIQVNRKNKTPVAYRFTGFMIQCINYMPRTKDRTDSLYRRCLYIPFNKCYTGAERKYIKDVYLNRREMLEYVLYRVLHMNYYEITVPASCRESLEEYKTFNNPILSFLEDTLPEACLGCIPPTLIYDMYKGWSKKNNPDGGLVGIKLFLKELESYDLSKYGWTYEDKYKRVGDRMFREEPLLDEYNCVDWMISPNYRVNIKNPPVTAKGLFKDNWQPKNTAGGYAFIDE